MSNLERNERDAAQEVAQPQQLTTVDVIGGADRISAPGAGGSSTRDTEALVAQGTIPKVEVPEDAGKSSAHPSSHMHGREGYSDILPSLDLELLRSTQNTGTSFEYQMYSRNKEDYGTLTAKDRENSIMYKIETGQVDGTKIFKNVNELLSGTQFENASERTQRPGDPNDRQQQRPTDESTRRAQGDQQPAPYRSDRLEINPDGSAKVPVKRGDTLWGIARETLRHGNPPGHTPTDREIANAVERLARANPQIRNRNVIREGRDVVTIPKDMIKEIPPERPLVPESNLRVENRGASPEFAARMQRQLDQLPPGVQRLLEANGTKIVVGDKVSGVYPELAGVRPRGWPPGSTWDNADGLYSPGDKTAVVTERRVDNGQTVQNERAEGVFKHEVGHAVDHAMGNFSQSEEFKQAYDRDVANLSPADRQRFEYLLQPGNAGKSEAFAEIFGALNGSTANPGETQETLRKFPALAALMQRKFDAM